MKKVIQEFNYLDSPSNELIIKTLKKDGVIVLNNFASKEFLDKLKNEFINILNGENENSKWFENRPYSLGKAAFITRGKEMQCNYAATYDFFSQPLMQTLTDSYLGKGFHANQKIFVVKDIIGTSHHANDLHFDVQQTLKFFLYLTDTTAKNGAFRCVPGSHKYAEKIRKEKGDKISYGNREITRQLPYGDEDTLSVDGKAGSLIIFDTDVFHQAGKVLEGERWVMRGQTEPKTQPTTSTSFIKRVLNKFR